MIKVYYKSGLYNYWMKSSCIGGMLATFSKNREVEVCTDKKLPIGFFLYDFSPDKNTYDSRCSVLVGQGDYYTDIFEKSKYKINDFLYCSCNGKITNELKYKGNIIVGVVNSVTKTEIGFVTCFSRGLEK